MSKDGHCELLKYSKFCQLNQKGASQNSVTIEFWNVNKIKTKLLNPPVLISAFSLLFKTLFAQTYCLISPGTVSEVSEKEKGRRGKAEF
jgi:hypothetical protein